MAPITSKNAARASYLAVVGGEDRAESLSVENSYRLVAPPSIRFRRAIIPYLFIFPKLAFFLVFMLGPLLWTVVMTFQTGGILTGQRFVGIENYQTIFRDPLFRLSLRNSFYYAFFVIPLALGFGILLAALLNRRIRIRPVFLVLLILPAFMSPVGTAVVWTNLLLTEGGALNWTLGLFGVNSVNWLGTPSLLMPIFIALELWRGTAFYAILFLAAMQTIPGHLYDAAAIDGATGYRAFRVVTLPLLRPAILFALVIATIFNLQLFDTPYVMTGGGPGYASMTIVMYIHLMAFRLDAMGLAATMSLILLTIIMVLALLQLVVFKKEIEF